MKKKASLWISGITTVAMLAVAVGSFAAWNTLSAPVPTISATSSTPTTLKVETSSDEFTNKKLVPTKAGADATNSEVETLSVNITPTLTKDSGSDKIIKLTKAELKYGGTKVTDNTILEMKIYKVSDAAKTSVKENDELESGEAYTVEVKFATEDGVEWTEQKVTEATAKDITLDVTCEATAPASV